MVIASSNSNSRVVGEQEEIGTMAKSIQDQNEEEQIPGHRVKRLLRSAGKRRTTFLSDNAATGAKEAATAWEINSNEQVLHWAQSDPGAVLKVLEALRKDRDTAIECLGHWKDIEDRLAAAEAGEANENMLQEEIMLLRKELKETYDSRNLAIEQRDQAIAQARATPAASLANTTNGGKRSPKHPDPPTLTNGQDPTYVDWALAIQDKLQVNEDHFNGQAAQALHVISRTGGNAAGHINAYRTGGKSNYFQTPLAVIEVLEDIYGDPDRERNARRAYAKLRQAPDQAFNIFYSEFKKQASYLSYEEKTLIDDLKDKVTIRLREALSICPVQFTELAPLKAYLQQVDNSQRVLLSDKARSDQRKVRFQAVAPVRKPLLGPYAGAGGVLSPNSFQRIPFPNRAITPVPATLTSGLKCFQCGSTSHLVKDCPHRSATPTRIQEVDEGNEEKGFEADEEDLVDSEN